MAFRFKNLEIWKLAIDYGERIHTLIKRFPRSELFVLSSDLNRAAISISSNIAEGSGSESNREFRRYLRIAIKSVFEIISQLFVATKRRYITENEFADICNDGELLVKKIKSFLKTISS